MSEALMESEAKYIDLSSDGAHAEMILEPVGNQRGRINGKVEFEKREGNLWLSVICEDPDNAGIIATRSQPNSDRFLFEEDAIQIFYVTAQAEVKREFCLVNPVKSWKGSESVTQWKIDSFFDERVWKLDVQIPRADEELAGIFVHRFYRGVLHGVYTLNDCSPYPLNDDNIVCIDYRGAGVASCEVFRQKLRDDSKRHVQAQVAATKAKMSPRQDWRKADYSAFLEEKLLERAKREVNSKESFLCWNEAYFQQALLDLWLATRETRWIEMLVPRMRAVLAQRADHRGIKDALFGRALPIWINSSETGTACTLTTGTICYPMARALHLISKDAGLESFRAQVAGLDEEIAQSLDYHEFEYIKTGRDEGVYLEPHLKGESGPYPRGGSREGPYNRVIFFILGWYHLAKLHGDSKKLERVFEIARYLRNDCFETRDGGLAWDYQRAATVSVGEDLGHAQTQIHLAELCAREERVFSGEDVRRIAFNLDRNCFIDGVPSMVLNHRDNLGLHFHLGLFSSLARHEEALIEKIVHIVDSVMANDVNFGIEGYHLRCLSVLNLNLRSLKSSEQTDWTAFI